MRVCIRLVLALIATASICWFSVIQAAVYQVAISPPAGLAVNIGSLPYPGDHALELSARNESNMPASTAAGGAFGPMSYDTITRQLALDFAYGSAFGFSDLLSNWNGGVHIHGNGGVTAQFPANNTNAGIMIDLGPFHTASGTRSGRVATTVTLTPTQHTWLLDHKLYLNVHSVTNAGGEIRGQLVLIPEPASLSLAAGALSLVVLKRRSRAG